MQKGCLLEVSCQAEILAAILDHGPLQFGLIVAAMMSSEEARHLHLHLFLGSYCLAGLALPALLPGLQPERRDSRLA